MGENVTVRTIFEKRGAEFLLELSSGEGGIDRPVKSAEISCMGLVLTGFLEHFPRERIQILDKYEISYLNSHPINPAALEKMFSLEIPAIIITNNLEAPEDFMRFSREFNTPVFRTPLTAEDLSKGLTKFLTEALAPSAVKHGVLMNVHGMGVLILGKSSIGKSECALELVKRGHLLVADDVVEIKRHSGDLLEGSGGKLIRHHMEIRGVGIIDIKNLFGISAVMDSTKIELVVQLEEWQGAKEYERLGLEDRFIEILGVKVTEITVPVKPGRNLAAIIEVASMNQRLKLRGYHTARELDRQLIQLMKEKQNDDII
jgi:HPr kinase/phosphorylase